MEIRPKPKHYMQWVEYVGFDIIESLIDLPPYHYGMLGKTLSIKGEVCRCSVINETVISN